MKNQVSPEQRIVITGVGLTAPNGNSLKEFRENLLAGKSGVQKFETRYMGKVLAGVCDFDVLRYQTKKEIRRGTRVGSIAIYCCREAFGDASIDLESIEAAVNISKNSKSNDLDGKGCNGGPWTELLIK